MAEVEVRLSAATVSDMRSQLKAQDNASLAVVRHADLPEGTPKSGPEQTEAVKQLLRRRLAEVIIARQRG